MYSEVYCYVHRLAVEADARNGNSRAIEVMEEALKLENLCASDPSRLFLDIGLKERLHESMPKPNEIGTVYVFGAYTLDCVETHLTLLKSPRLNYNAKRYLPACLDFQ
jgi:hypothetical protein